MRKRAVIDANLLVLLAVGTANRRYIAKHKRCRVFLERDFDTLLLLLQEASEIILTPNTLTETSNLAAQIEEPARGHILMILKNIIERFSEIYIQSKDVVYEPVFNRLGLTDAALVHLSRNNTVIITVDFDLYNAAFSAGCEAINFTHVLAANQ